ncbi:MAG: thioredoxin-disulfide reductase [Terriglobales bacterium]
MAEAPERNAVEDVVILGTGCSGLTAAIYAARAGLRPLVVDGHESGGQLALTTLVENFPGFPEGIQGPDLVDNMRQQAARFGARYCEGSLEQADLSGRPLRLVVADREIRTRSLIIASGASARWLNLPAEKALIGHGVSSCATCDGFFFKGKPVIVVGGGDSAMEEALFLTRFATAVTIVHRREQFRASKIMLERAKANPKIHWIANAVVEEILDVEKKEVTAVRLRDTGDGRRWEMPVAAVFLGIGHVPNAAPFAGQLERDAEGYLKTRDYVLTSVPGVYACGDVQDRRYRQAVTAAGTGCMAAIEAERFLEAHGH